MAVTLTRVIVRKLLSRTASKLSDGEVDQFLSDATEQVAEWKTESDANAGAIVAMSQFDENRLAKLYMQLEFLSDRMSSQAEVEEDYEEVAAGRQQATRRKFNPRYLEKAWEKLKSQLDELLNKLGVTTQTEMLPALATSCIRAEEYTGSEADPGIDWTKRNDIPDYFNR